MVSRAVLLQLSPELKYPSACPKSNAELRRRCLFCLSFTPSISNENCGGSFSLTPLTLACCCLVEEDEEDEEVLEVQDSALARSLECAENCFDESRSAPVG